MDAQSTPVRNKSIGIPDAFHEITPVRKHISVKSYFCKGVKREIIDTDEDSDAEPFIRSQVHKTNKKSKENEKRKSDKRTLFFENHSKCQNNSDDLIGDDENFYVENASQFCSSKIQFFDSGIDKLLVNVNCNLEKNAESIDVCTNSEEFNSKLFKKEFSNESLSASDVMKWSSSSLASQTHDAYFSKFIKKKLFENANKKDVIKSQTSGWTQYKLIDIQQNAVGDVCPVVCERTFHGLPARVQQLYEEHKGIKKLFSWQEDCLNSDAVKQKKNLVYSLPTSGGKSLVAEILILRELLIHHKNVLLILPFVSIVQEKIRDFSPFALEFHFCLEEYAAGKGVIPPKKRKKKNSLMIATIEKGLIVLNSLIEAKRLQEMGLVVVDELHLLSEEKRGPTLEILLIQILHCEEKIQIIGMTATIGNLEEIAKFLKAETFKGNFRPVRLTEYLKCGNKVYSLDFKSEKLMKETRTLESPNEEDSDGIAQLVQEIIPKDSVLVFCPTKKNCENVAALISQFLSRELIKHKEEEKSSLFRALVSETNEKICPTLKQTLPFGVAYHHSGLTAGERKLLEEAFRLGTLSVICCTSTLAAGVNLPAKRVILRSPYVGKDFITLSKYKQMVGRAGRMGFGSEGDSFLICQPGDSEKVGKLFQSKMDETISKMDLDSCKDLILSSIGLGIAATRKNLKQLLTRSLLHSQLSKLNKDSAKLVDECIVSLYKQGALTVKNQQSLPEERAASHIKVVSSHGNDPVSITNDCQLGISRLGRAAIKGGLSLDMAYELYGELVRAQASLVLFTNLHLLYLVTPFDLMSQIKPNYQIFFNVYLQMDAKEIHAAQAIGITESVVSKLAIGARPKNIKENVLNRFYISLIINELWKQKTIWDVAQLFQLPRGLVQTVMTSAATFVNSVLRFCEALEEFWSFKSLFSEFAPRLAYCCAPELLPLMELPAVKKGRARQLYNAGFKSLQSIAVAHPADLVRAIDHIPRSVATQIVAAAKVQKLLLMEKAEGLREEAEVLLEGLNERYAPKIF